MLKFLTHKLRTHSLNEENVTEKVEERDSGTESDDEADRADTGEYCADVVMKWNEVTDIRAEESATTLAPPPPRLPAHHDHTYDHHSSEEELEVINAVAGECGVVCGSRGGRQLRRAASSPPLRAPEKRRHHLAFRPPSDDDEDSKVETPVRFRTSPPREALKPRAPPRRTPAPRRPRPALDFDKMQQLKVGGGVRSWRAAGGAGGELSVFCW